MADDAASNPGVVHTVASVRVPFTADLTDMNAAIKAFEDRIEAIPEKFKSAFEGVSVTVNDAIDKWQEKIDKLAEKAAEVKGPDSATSGEKSPDSEINDQIAAAIKEDQDELKKVNQSLEEIKGMLAQNLLGQ